ncbi:MAG: sedoheptulokinase [Candidatus Brocadiia bacterium]
MRFHLGVDVGTTKIAAVVVDSSSGREVVVKAVPNDTETTSAADKARGRSEWDAAASAKRTFECIAAAVRDARGGEIKGIGVTGQMHGTVLLANGSPISPFIGWQDRRCQEMLPGRDVNYIDRMMQLAGVGGFAGTGCTPATGYMASTLFWLAQNGNTRVTKSAARPTNDGVMACFLPDYLVLRLTGHGPVTDSTDAAGSGVLDVASGAWNNGLISKLGLRTDIFAPILKAGAVAGGLTAEAANALGLEEGIPVCVGCGDNQAGFAGSVADPPDSILVNIGTGAQVSAWVPGCPSAENLDTRPHLDGGFLLVGAPLCGGVSYAFLRDFLLAVGREFFGAGGDEDIYAKMNSLAAAAPAGADGLRCEPLFTGSRSDPQRRASWNGMSPANFTPGHFARAIIEGIVEQVRLHYADMLGGGMKPRRQLICTGNGVRRNPLFSQTLSAAFQMPLRVTVSTEEAAFGAALLAAVASGEFASLRDAARLIAYSPL